ncbi:hypothetical protein [Thermobifida cellulosilytica]|mgnify:CR=1 FL=1|uniref:ABC transporter permease n=1 Tax=Thermobifida cellulosilytica TB100 TaxID=665004 RepID=A0A147KGP4_THECS|nr:hypothetical protein [Thermobifida cellulosilytica]KUP96484.1 hypothetical protein AC529_12060 [Thermobifida cellulosilytica TB100]
MNLDLGHVTAAEADKLRTLPAALATVAATVAGTAGLAALLAVVARDAADAGAVSALRTALQAVGYTQVGFVLLGVLTVTTEYSGGQIHASLTSVPRRTVLLVGKAAAYLAAALPAAAGSVAAAVAAAQLVLGGLAQPLGEQFAEDGLRPPVGAVAYLVLVGLLSGAVAVPLRSTVAALAVLLPVLLVVPSLLETVTDRADYFPTLAGARMYGTGPVPDDALGPLLGGAVLAAWTAAAAVAAAVVFHRRDA